MSDNVRIQITAKDDASDDFQRIGKAAQNMGQQVQNAGKAAGSGLTPIGPAAKNAQKALTDVETQAKKTAASSDDIKKKWTEVGAAAGTLVGGLALVGRAYVEQERQIDGLERAYGDASTQLIEFAEDIQKTTVYSNDAARAATLSAASLAQNYGLTADQIEEVVKASADLATVTGVDLQDATMRVAGAIRGEGEAAELLGLNMSDAAVAALAAAAGLEGWNTTMTEGEKAAFRYTVAMDQAAFATGAAADAAETNAGNARQFVNSLQDQAQALGGAIGPAAEYASVLGSFALAAPVAGAALGRLATGVKIAASAIGPAGLIAAGVGAVVVLGEMTDWFGLFGDEAKAAVPPVENLSDAVLQLAQAGLAAETITRLTGATGELKTALDELSTESVLAEIEAATKAAGDIATTQGLLVNVQALIETGASSGNAALDAQVAKIRELRGEMATLEADGESLAVSLTEGIIGRLDEPMIDVNRALGDLATWIHELKTGEITLGEYNALVEDMGVHFSEVYGELPQATAALGEWHRITMDQRAALEATALAMRDVTRLAGPMREGLVDPNADDMGLPDATAEAERNAAAHEAIVASATRTGAALRGVSAAAAEESAALREAQDAVVAYIASGENLLQLLYDSGKELSGEQGFLRGVIDLQNALTGLESAYTIIIEGSEALGATSDNLAQWAQGLIDAGNAGPALDSLNQIIATNADVQADILAIQQAQAPYLANLNAETAEYVDWLAQQDAQQQRNVLTLADANSQQQLAAVYAAATDAAMGNLGANGTQYVQDMVNALRISNPLLYEYLQTTGAIDANGVFQFDASDATSLVSTLGDLNTNLENLVQVLAEINGIDLDLGDGLDKAAGAAERLLEKMRGVNDAAGGTGGFLGNLAGAFVGAGGGDPANVGNNGGNAREGPKGGGVSQDVTVTFNADAEPYFRVSSDVQANAELLAGTEQQLLITADGEQAIGVFRDVEGAIVAITDGQHIVKVTGDPTDATNDIALVNRVLNDLNGTEGVIYVEGDPAGALSAVQQSAAALGGIDGSSATVYVNAIDNASSLIRSLTGLQGSAYINVFASPIGNFGPTALGLRDGGVVGYDAAALDGIVTKSGMRRILVGESGPELLNLPPGSGVTPASMTSALRGKKENGGKELHFHFHAPVYGVDDLQQMIGQAVRSVAYQGQY